MTARSTAPWLFALALLAGRAARAEDAAPPPAAPAAPAPDRAAAAPAPAAAAPAVVPPAPAPAAAPAQARLRASHRVDVIAPGEKVDSVIDRMRAQRPQAPPPAARPADVPTRGPGPRSERTREGMQGVPGGSWMPGPDGPPPPMRGDGMPPDHHRR